MRTLIMSLAVGTALAVVSPVFAQTPAAPAVKAAVPAGVFFKGQTVGQYMAKDKLLGLNVLSKDGTVIGSIEDLILSTSNTVEGVIIGVGGVAGIGEKKIGVRYGALQIATKDGKTTITLPQASKDVLAAVEPYKRADAPRSLLQKAGDKAKELTDKTKEAAGPALDKAKEVGKAAVDKTKELGKGAAEKTKEMMDGSKTATPPKQ